MSRSLHQDGFPQRTSAPLRSTLVEADWQLQPPNLDRMTEIIRQSLGPEMV